MSRQRDIRRTLRISINTLGADSHEDLTSRIQKELVKQLVYRADPGQVRRSRFARGKDLTRYTALRDAAVVGTILFGLLWLFGVQPSTNTLKSAHPALPMVTFFLLVVLSAWMVRWVIGNRFISQFSTGGTSISFANQPDSYFDEYLDEIMAFFDATQPDVVVFEDLDRFDDPQIFDSLRELNTLITTSASWNNKKHPLRFVYAIKDSLFERLGIEPHPEDEVKGSVAQEHPGDVTKAVAASLASVRRRDAVELAVERANRTKFFEIVIPVVPFLSHSNARDLLSDALRNSNMPAGTEISRGLLDLVARHVTDMRLMINICNEFAVFAERLLWIPTEDRAPGMSADSLFALVVYKNFHLADFEKLPHRASDLDALERTRQRLVRDSIGKLQQRRRELADDEKHQNKQNALAKTLGERLRTFLESIQLSISSITLDDREVSAESIDQPDFWKTAQETKKVSITVLGNTYFINTAISYKTLSILIPECADPVHWRDPSHEELAEQRASIDTLIATLRGASFADLAKDTNFTVDGKPFESHLETILQSELARDLVRRAFVDRYYAEYSAVFYGNFLGVDVANFFRNSVWPNEMDIDARFTTPDAVANILYQAPNGFTSSRSALNIEIVDYVLAQRPKAAKELVGFLGSDHGEDGKVFLDAYLNDAASLHKVELIDGLARYPWRGVVDHIARPESVIDEATRSQLLDAALLAAHGAKDYELGPEAKALIVDRHAELTAFTKVHDEGRVEAARSFMRRSGLIVPLLKALSVEVRQAAVEDGTYTLTLDNLRAALDLDDQTTPTLDRIWSDRNVWRRCREEIDTYLDAIAHNGQKTTAVEAATTLGEVITDQINDWTDGQIQRLLELSPPEAALPDIAAVPQTSWPAIAEARRLIPTVPNLHAYSQAFGVEEHLRRVLVSQSGKPAQLIGIEKAAADIAHAIMVRILNASTVLCSSDRVQLALQLKPQTASESLIATEIQPAEDDLLADALDTGLLPDTAETFAHFLQGGWRSVSTAFKVSKAAKEFLSPSLVTGQVLELLEDPIVPNELKTLVVRELEAYAADGNGDVLKAAATFAYGEQIHLSAQQVLLAASHAALPEEILWQIAELGNNMEGREITRALGQLGSDYEGFIREPGYEFDVPITDSIEAILDLLRRGGSIELPGGGKKGWKKVRLL